jgi:hypothetical protein
MRLSIQWKKTRDNAPYKIEKGAVSGVSIGDAIAKIYESPVIHYRFRRQSPIGFARSGSSCLPSNTKKNRFAARRKRQ